MMWSERVNDIAEMQCLPPQAIKTGIGLRRELLT